MTLCCKRIIIVLIPFLALLMSGQAQELKGKKVFYINSYNEGYAWSDGEQKAILNTLAPTGVKVKTVLMNTYLQPSREHLIQVSKECKRTIDEWHPDVVIVSDDSPMLLLWPYFKNSGVPFVFCGVNWDASKYGIPAKNITGMLEVCPVKDLLNLMSELTKGRRIGYLAADTPTPRIDGENFARILGGDVTVVLAKDFTTWKQRFLELQSKVDLLALGPSAGILDWNESEASKFAEENTKIVTGAWHDFMNGVAIISYNKLPEEQGKWAANAAIKIMKGTPCTSIPITKNVEGELVINLRIAKKSGIYPPFELIESARLIK